MSTFFIPQMLELQVCTNALALDREDHVKKTLENLMYTDLYLACYYKSILTLNLLSDRYTVLMLHVYSKDNYSLGCLDMVPQMQDG